MLSYIIDIIINHPALAIANFVFASVVAFSQLLQFIEQASPQHYIKGLRISINALNSYLPAWLARKLQSFFMHNWLNTIIANMLETQKDEPDVLKEICGYVQFLAL